MEKREFSSEATFERGRQAAREKRRQKNWRGALLLAAAVAMSGSVFAACGPTEVVSFEARIRRTDPNIPELHVLSAAFSNEPPLIEWSSPRYVDLNYQIQICYLDANGACNPSETLDLIEVRCEGGSPCQLTWGNGETGENVGFRREDDFWGDQKLSLHDACSESLISSPRDFLIRIRAFHLDGTAGPWAEAAAPAGGSLTPWYTCPLEGRRS